MISKFQHSSRTTLAAFTCLLFAASTDANPSEMDTSEDSYIETFTFAAEGINRGKIYLPSNYDSTLKHPALFLMDFQEQHYGIVTDEFEQLIEATSHLADPKPLVVTLEEHLDVDVKVDNYETYFELFKNLAEYISNHYSTTGQHTLVGRGSEGGAAMLGMLKADEKSHNFKSAIVTGSPVYFIAETLSLVERGEIHLTNTDIRLHYSIDENYELELNRKLIKQLSDNDYPWLSLETVEYPHLSFETAYQTAFTDGVKFLFE